jgi:hypothetical protein
MMGLDITLVQNSPVWTWKKGVASTPAVIQYGAKNKALFRTLFNCIFSILLLPCPDVASDMPVAGAG